jgi:peptide/nickel transport system substrate-binding protein
LKPGTYMKGFPIDRFSGVIALLLIAIGSWHCKSPEKDPGLLVIRLLDDPDGLNPITARSVLAVPLISRIFQPLCDYDPRTLELRPVLIDSLSKQELYIDPLGDTLYRFPLRIVTAARWDDGSPVRVSDYLFTLKMQLLCELYGSSAPVYTELAEGVLWEMNPDSSVSIYFPSAKRNSMDALLTLPVLPLHFYDSTRVSEAITLEMLSNPRKLERAYKADARLQQLAENFNQAIFAREKISGSGPYRFEAWEAGQYIRLGRKENYWGDSLSQQRIHLTAFPKQLLYKIIPDDAAAIQALTNKSLDIAGDISPDLFFKMKTDEGTSGQFAFYTPPAFQYFYICPNYRVPGLEDWAVRRAMAHLLNVPSIIESFFFGSATTINGPVHPIKKYYNRELKLIPYNTDEAKRILGEAGWADLNSDGVLDKVRVEGDTVSLRFRLMTGQRKLGQDIALVFKQDAAKAGIQIDLDVVDNTQFITRLQQGSFDLANLSGRFSPGYDDLFFTWHTQSQNGAGNNFMHYGNARTDSLIEAIALESDPVQKEAMYMTFQKIIHEDQPVLFLCAPDERVIAQKSLEVTTTALKPGYFEPLIRTKQ